MPFVSYTERLGIVTERLPTFWQWLLRGNGGLPGIRRVANGWAFLHLAIGTLLAYMVSTPVDQVAEKALIPLLAIFVGLTFSWAGNAHALLQSNEIINFSTRRMGGIAEYIFTFQLCILIILITICLWLIPSLHLRYLLGELIPISSFNCAASAALYGFLSLAIRTSWQAVLGVNMLLLSRSTLIRRRGAGE